MSVKESDEVDILINESGDGEVKPEVKSVRTLADLTPGIWTKLQVEITGGVMEDRVGHTLVSVPTQKAVYMIGGGNHGGDTDQLWEITLQADGGLTSKFQAELSAAFPPRYEFLCGVTGSGESVVVFGGADNISTRNDVVVLDLPTKGVYSPFEGSPGAEPDVPVPRTQGTNSCIMKLRDQDCLVVFGGGLRSEKAVEDGNLYLFNLEERSWNRVEVTGSTPPPVQGHGMVAVGTLVFIFGGMDNFLLFDELYMIDLSLDAPAWIQLRFSGPGPCARAAYGITTLGNDIYVCAGLGHEGALADMWKFNVESREWTQIESGEGYGKVLFSPRLDFAMTSLVLPGVTEGQVEGQGDAGSISTYILLHGGMNTYGEIFSDFWIYPLSP